MGGNVVGTITKPIGSVIGGVTGGLISPISQGLAPQAQAPRIGSSDFQRQQIAKARQELLGPALGTLDVRGAQVTGRQAPQLDLSRQAQFRTQQQQLAEQLARQSRGEGPSLAEAQLRSASDRNLRQQLALAAGQRGGSQAARQRQILTQQAQTGQELAQQAAQARLAEQFQAQQALGQVTQAGRAQDIQLATQQQQAALQQQQLNDALEKAILAQGFQQRNLATQALLSAGDIETQKQLAQLQAEAGTAAANQQAQSAVTGGLLSAGGGIGAALIKNSDKNLKKDIKDGSKSANEFLKALSAKTFKYKDKKKSQIKGNDDQLGIIAQELEKSEFGKQMVEDGPNGKQININSGFGAVLAAQAELNKRLEALESGINKRKKKKEA